VAELENSARKLLRATYAQIKPKPSTRKPRRSKMAWPKHSFVANLKIMPDELSRLKRLLKLGRPAVIALDAVVNSTAVASDLDNVARFAEIDWQLLVLVAEKLAKLREDDLKQFRHTYAIIFAAYEKRRSTPDRIQGVAIRKGQTQTRLTAKMVTARSATDVELERSFASVPLTTVLEWAVENGVKATEAKKALELIPKLFAVSSAATKEDLEGWFVVSVQQARNYAGAMKRYMAVEPIGLLHLERLNFVPAGIERGELVHSVPLSPGEEVNISHKEWSHTSEEFSKIVTDFMEAYSEEGVTEKSELAQTTSSQDQHSSGFNTGVTASGGYGPVSITTAVNYNVADSASHSEQVARNHSSELTRKASARSKKEHKISFKVASAAGTEDQQVRKIKNPFADRATRIDYYQLVRKWRVDLFRYGLRLTYDLAIPEPGAGILSKIQDIEDIKAALQMGFGDPTVPKTSPAWFDLTPSAITREDYIAGKYGEIPDPPPEPEIEIPVIRYIEVTSNDNIIETNTFFLTLGFEVQEGYEITSVTEVDKGVWNHDTPYTFRYRPDDPEQSHLVGLSGQLIIVIETRNIWKFFVNLRIKASLRPEVYAAWQAKAWKALRDAAQARYEENRQNLNQRLSSLLEELGAQDALSLRKIEREEVMKGVIRWLFGPSFEFAPPGVPESLFGSDFVIPKGPWGPAWVALASAFMAELLAKGEIIKFLHHAIEWENMLYFLYPYFWSHHSRWEFKKYLNYPDLMHRVFLKSGSARVVLTIRPGFEKAFVSFLETGKFDQQDVEYLSIAKEMEFYAKTNYPGLRPANPVEGARPLLYPKQQKAWEEMQTIVKLIDGENGYFKKFGTYPSTLNDLQSVLPYDEDPNDDVPPITAIPLQDPWGHDYVYTFPGLYNSYDLVSYGADSTADKDQTDPEKIADVLNADITSWAEASLIGRWYEYTPTSALDIAFDEIQPSA
jgi:Type II secretion system (T2SS), protein G